MLRGADVPHGRLALLLLDNAAEMSLTRTARGQLGPREMYAGMAHLLRDVDPHDEEGWTLKRTIERETVSKKQKRQVERNLDALVDCVFGAKEFALSADFAECLKILHRYHNAAYHRDTVEQTCRETIDTSGARAARLGKHTGQPWTFQPGGCTGRNTIGSYSRYVCDGGDSGQHDDNAQDI